MWRQEFEAAGHIALTVGSREVGSRESGVLALNLLFFFFLI